MYEGVKTSVEIDGGVSEEFEVNVEVHQGSVLGPLLLIIVMEALSREFRVGLPWQLLYADDLVLMAETKEKLMAELLVWKDHLKAKGLIVNVGKTKVMRSAMKSGLLEKSSKWPCSICLKGGGANSIKCKEGKQWMLKRCSSITEALKGVVGFNCNVCRDKVIS